jgi:TPR repeat protein
MGMITFYGLGTILRALVLRDTENWHSVGAKFAMGNGLPKSERAAVWSYTQGARRGNAHCQYDLGFMMILGQGTVVKTNEGVQWLKRAANQDDFSAIRLLFDLYSHGYYGVPALPDEAERWRQAAYRVEPGSLWLQFTGIEENITAANNVEALERLTDQIRLAIKELKAGEFYGHSWNNNWHSITIIGPDPDALWNAAEPILNRFPALRRCCRVTKRYGPNIEGVREETFDLTV